MSKILLPPLFALLLTFGFLYQEELTTLSDLTRFWGWSLLFFFACLAFSLFVYLPQKPSRKKLLAQLTLPLLLQLSLTFFLLFRRFGGVEIVLIIVSFLAFWGAFSEKLAPREHLGHDLLRFFVLFLLYFDLLEARRFFGLATEALPPLLALLSFLFFLHLLWHRRADLTSNLFFVTLGSGVIGGIGWLALDRWQFHSYLVLSLVLLTLYYVFWGILHHRAKGTLCAPVFLEYLLVGGIVVLLLLGMTSL